MLPILVITSLFHTLLILCSSQCLARTQIDNIIQDSFEIRIQQNQHKLIYSYPTFIFQSFPQIALSISKFQWKQFKNIDFNIRAQINQQKGGLQIQFLHTDMKWRSIRINFWLIERSDMITGITNFRIFFSKLENIKEYNAITKTLELSKQLQSSSTQNKLTIFTSIISMKAQTLQQTFQVTTKSIALNKVQFNISIETGANTQIQNISIAYLLYQPSTLSIISHHYGSLEAKFNIRKVYNQPLFSIKIYPIRYLLLGISSMRILGSRDQTLSLSMHVTQDPTDLITVISSSNRLDFFRANYFIIGKSMMMSCIECSNSYIYQNINNEALCIAKQDCEHYRTQNYQQMYFSCRKCPQSQNMMTVFNDRGNSFCQCKQGFSIQSNTGRCIKQYPTNSLRECPGMFQTRENNGTCVCQNYYVRDEFGLCGGVCSTQNSFWNAQTRACKCFHGYEIRPPSFSCQPLFSDCKKNQIFVDGNCQCNINTILNDNGQCVFCPSGSYKSQQGKCIPCNSSCLQCLSLNSCTQCSVGYYLQNFKCQQICGDGLKMDFSNKTVCDDGNTQNNDGCSSQCKIEEGFQCEGGSQISQDICYPEQSLIQISDSNSIPNNEKKQQVFDPTFKFADNSQQIQNITVDYKLKLKPKSPIYLNSGIIIDLFLLPQQKRTQKQIKSMINVKINDTIAQPQAVYLTVDQQHPQNVRCYLHYNNQLPILDFIVNIKVFFAKNIEKSLNIYTNSLTNAVTSALGSDGDDYIL